MPPSRPFPPPRDLVTDAAALALLLVALLSAWDNGHRGVDHAAVVLLTAVSALSLAVGWLARTSLAPPTWTAATTRRLRLLAGAAYTALVVVQISLDGLARPPVAGGWRGTGLAVGIGLAGAVLAARPRSDEVGGTDEAGVARLWRAITTGLAVACALLLLVGTAFDASGIVGVLSPLDGRDAVVATLLTLGSTLQVLVLLVPLLGLVASRGARWGPATVAVGASWAVLLLWGQVGPEPAMTTIQEPVVAVLLLPAAAAAGLVVGRAGPAHARGRDRVAAVAPLCVVIAASAAAHAVQVVSQMLFSSTLRGTGGTAVIAVLLLLGAVALRARTHLLRGGATTLRERAVLGGGVALLGAAGLAADAWTSLFSTWGVALAGEGVVPVALLVMLTVPLRAGGGVESPPPPWPGRGVSGRPRPRPEALAPRSPRTTTPGASS